MYSSSNISTISIRSPLALSEWFWGLWAIKQGKHLNLTQELRDSAAQGFPLGV